MKRIATALLISFLIVGCVLLLVFVLYTIEKHFGEFWVCLIVCVVMWMLGAILIYKTSD